MPAVSYGMMVIFIVWNGWLRGLPRKYERRPRWPTVDPVLVAAIFVTVSVLVRVALVRSPSSAIGLVGLVLLVPWWLWRRSKR